MQISRLFRRNWYGHGLCHVFAAIGTHASKLHAVRTWLLDLRYLQALSLSALGLVVSQGLDTYSERVMTVPLLIIHRLSTPSTLDSNLVVKRFST